jgi:Protein of unknown function (DUF1676)
LNERKVLQKFLMKYLVLLGSSELARSFPNDPEKRLDGYLVAKMTSFLQTHTLRLRLMETAVVDPADQGGRSDDFSGRKGKIGKKGGLEGILAAAMMMKGEWRFRPSITFSRVNLGFKFQVQ